MGEAIRASLEDVEEFIPDASGCVIKCEGKRGTVFRLKYRDDSSPPKQTMETLGKASAFK
jgi:hypothetical protein